MDAGGGDGLDFLAKLCVHVLDDKALKGISGIVQTANGDLWLNGLGGMVHLAHEEIVKAMKDRA